MLAVQLVPPAGAGELVLDGALYEVPPPHKLHEAPGTFQARSVTLRAVVCDLGSPLPDGPACVKACPHEATLRFDARAGVPLW